MITHFLKYDLPGKSAVVVCMLALYAVADSARAEDPAKNANGFFQDIAPFRVEYTAQRSGITLGKTIFSLSRNSEGIYSYEGRAEPGALLFWYRDGLANENSMFTVVDGNIRSNSYEYFVGNGDDKHSMVAKFNWDSAKVDVVYNKKKRTLPLTSTTYDRAAVQLIVMRDLFNNKQELNYKYVDRKKIRSYNFRRLGEEWLETELGLLKVLKIESVYQSKKKGKEPRRTTFWCAPELAYLPVKIEQQVGDGGISAMLVDKVEGRIVPSKINKAE